MLRHIMLAVAALSLTATVSAKPPCDEIERQVDKIFAPWSVPGSPGMSVGVYRNGHVVLTKGYGIAHLEHDVPITAETVFYLGSVSKQFVAAAVLLLVQDGKLSLDDDVRDHVPELPDYGMPITVRQLMHHTSGLRDYLGLLQLAGLPVDQYHNDRDIIALLARQRALNFEPGTQHSYSNSGYFLLNVIVERVSGKSLRDFAEQRIFEPLGMANTHFHDDFRHIIRNRAMGYFPGPRKTYKQFMTTFDRVGSGGVYSNVIDLFQWEQNFQIHTVGGETLYKAQHKRGRLSDGELLDYTAGLVHGRHRGLKTVEHGGALGGYRSVFLRFPKQRLAVVVLANLSNVTPGQLARRVADLYLSDVYPDAAPNESEFESPVLIDRSKSELEPFAGHYWNRSAGLIREIRLVGDKLYYVRSPLNRTELGATAKKTFVMIGVEAHVPVVFSDNTMTVTAPSEGTVVYESYEPHQATKAELAELSGIYHSSELESSFTLSANSGVLLVKTPDNRRIPLRPVTRDVFVLPQARVMLAVDRDGAGVAHGFRLDAGNMRGLVFERESK